MIVCNSLEAMPAALSIDLNKYIPVIFYTHEESMVFRDTRKFKGVFSESCNEFFNNLMNLDNCYIGTQSDRNVNEISDNGGINVKKLPMPMSERGLLVENNETKIPSYTLNEIKDIYNLNFNVLVAVCEVFLEVFFEGN